MSLWAFHVALGHLVKRSPIARLSKRAPARESGSVPRKEVTRFRKDMKNIQTAKREINCAKGGDPYDRAIKESYVMVTAPHRTPHRANREALTKRY